MSTFQDNIVKFKSNKKYMTILYVVIALLFIAFFLYQVFKINYEPVKTEAALEKTVSASAVTQAFIVRDEYPIEASVTGTLVPLVEDGKRVASGDNVAVVFTNDDAAKTYNEIKELEKKIEYYASLQNKVGVQTADITPLDERIYSACGDYVAAVNRGKIDSLKSYEDKIRDAVTSRQLSTGAVIDPSVKLAELNTQLEQLTAKNIGYSTITAPHPGYYISVADGYESTVNYADVPNMSTAEIAALFNNSAKAESSEKYMCKLVDGFNWYFLCLLDYDDAVKLQKGETVDVAFTMTTAEPLKATVVNIAETVDYKAAVILKSNLMNTEYAGLRNEQIRITFYKHTGYQISNKAIREVDGQKGVYVLSGNIVKFKKINIAYSDSEYSIVNNPENEKGFVELYDEVITEGVDLYDGKIID
jgi:hypothetical protein